MKRLTSSTTSRIFILSVFCLSSIAALLGANWYWASSAESRKDAITLRATGRANPRINFQNGRNLKAQYAAAGVASTGIEKALKQGQAQALSLASEDINQDGFPDLVCGYAGSG